MTKSHYLSVPWLLLLDHQPHLYSPQEAAAAQGKISSEQRTCYVQIVISEGSQRSLVRREKLQQCSTRMVLKAVLKRKGIFFILTFFFFFGGSKKKMYVESNCALRVTLQFQYLGLWSDVPYHNKISEKQ